MINNGIKIILDNGTELETGKPNDLGIKLNRIVEDYSDPSARFGDFSYTVIFPITKANRKAWEFPDVHGRTRIFVGKSFPCKVFDGTTQLLKGIIELTSFDKNGYGCVFYSSLTELVDDLKGLKLVDMTSLPIIEWDYENTIANHINANLTIEDTDYQFIYTYYKPPVMTGATGIGVTRNLKAEDVFGYYYNYISSSLNFGEKNPHYFGDFPPAIYLRSIVEGMLTDAGWTLGGTFFNHADVKRIVIPFTGNAEDFSGSILTGLTGSFSTGLNLNKLLPDMDQIDFLSSVINAYRLYFTIDPIGKQIDFETDRTFFASTANAYNLTDKIDEDSITISKIEAEPQILFSKDSNNTLVAGYNRVLDYNQVSAGEPDPTTLLSVNHVIRGNMSLPLMEATYNKNAYELLWNKTTGNATINLAFSPVNYYSYTLFNDRSVDNTTYSDGTYPVANFTFGIPLISDQTPQDTKGRFYAKEGEDYCVSNAVANAVYNGGLKMLFYYGLMPYEFELSGLPYYEWAWFGIASGGTCANPGSQRMYLPTASPYQLLTLNQKNALVSKMNEFTTAERLSEVGAEAHNLLITYYTSGTVAGTHESSSFSLTMGENSLYPNLYSTFHEQKYTRLRNGHILDATMSMDSNDWNEMQINRPLSYNRELYSLVAIKNYDPIEGTASVTLLKR